MKTKPYTAKQLQALDTLTALGRHKEKVDGIRDSIFEAQVWWGGNYIDPKIFPPVNYPDPADPDGCLEMTFDDLLYEFEGKLSIYLDAPQLKIEQATKGIKTQAHVQ